MYSSLRLIALTAMLACANASVAMGSSSEPASSDNPDYIAGKRAIDAKNWSVAIDRLNAAQRRDSGNADIENLLGYAYRNKGDLDNAFRHYDVALKLDPKHRGAHEYVGEAWLMVGNLPKAEEQLAALDKLCLITCEEYRELKAKIQDYKEKAK